MAILTSGSFYVSTPAETTNDAGVATKALGTTTLMRAQGFDMPASNRLRYTGATTRSYEVVFHGSASKSSPATSQTTWYLYKNGAPIIGASVQRTVSSATDVGAFAMVAQVELAQNDYVEIYCETDDGDDLTLESGVLSIKVIG